MTSPTLTLRPGGRQWTSALLACLMVLALLPCLALPAHGQDASGEEDDDFFEYDPEAEDDFFEYDPEDGGSAEIADPLEPFNRVMFRVNNRLYRGVLKPVAVAYRRVPRPVRVSVANALDNLGTPVSAINALLQLDFRNTGTETARFAVNSTLGILGLFDPASQMGLERDEEDLGQTFGRYGIGQGFYLVIPMVGPTSLRDSVGRAGNIYIDPFMGNLATEERIGVAILDAENALSLDQDTYESLYSSALDPYTFFRSTYAQNRAGEVAR